MSESFYCWQFFQENLVTIRPQSAALIDCFQLIASQLNALLLQCKDISHDPVAAWSCNNTQTRLHYYQIEGELSEDMQASFFTKLCDYCFDVAAPTASPTTPASVSTTAAPTILDKHARGGASAGEIVGIIFAVMFIVSVAMVAGCWCYRKKQDRDLTRYEALQP